MKSRTGGSYLNGNVFGLVVAASVFGLIVFLLGWRVNLRLPANDSRATLGHSMVDFRDAVYYPAVAWWEGGNPYSVTRYMSEYPVGQPFLTYSPISLLIHLPFILLPFSEAAHAYWATSVVLLIVLSTVSLRHSGMAVKTRSVLWLASAAILAYPVYRNFLSGQVTFLVVLGTYLAVRYAETRPWVAGAGVALATIKPTYGVPLMLILILRRNYRTVALGASLAAGLAFAVCIPLAMSSGGWLGVFEVFRKNAIFTESLHKAGLPWTRLDLVATLARFTNWDPTEFSRLALLGLVVGVTGLALKTLSRIGDDDDRNQLSIVLITTSILISVVHNVYDAALLLLPVASLSSRILIKGDNGPFHLHALLLVLLLVPLVNWMPADTLLSHFEADGLIWRMALSLNGVSLVVAWAVAMLAAFLMSRRSGSSGPPDQD